MARAKTLGPSVAPRLVKLSTVHDTAFLWLRISHNGTAQNKFRVWISACNPQKLPTNALQTLERFRQVFVPCVPPQIQFLSDLEGLRSAPFQFIETLWLQLSPFMERTIFQSTMTIHQLPDLFVDVVSTYLVLACGKLPYRSCLRVLALPSKYPIYPFLFLPMFSILLY
ncbi:hypothetical protein ISN45_Aa01g026890 [Arabidopsis thaliana x Arabidopsis arenosa]|uniref:Uncharacterized protein n=1 Tax=Arabidopsis thaliana x Arabidopsis arenosa TaxID=1240361 RepID=A0A8T2C777_9BRAS|nr:hypothetical protein ISN45_Aa01g026890 [Arabidopsis thaliana x Arabidopsis arenosa]